jgi:hypothetical protein
MFLFPGGPAIAVPAAITFADSTASSANQTAYTFSGHAIGTASSDRYVVIAISGRDTAATFSVSSVTVGGANCSLAHASAINQTGTGATEIWITDAPFTSGTTADIIVTWSEGIIRMGIGVFALTGANGTASAGSNSGHSPSGTVVSTTITIAANGVGVACSQVGEDATAVWVGLTERYEEAMESGTHTGSSGAFSTIQSGITVSNTWSITGDVTLAVAAFDAA